MTGNHAPDDGRGAFAKNAPSGEAFDERLVDPADRMLLAALRGGAFKLAVECDVCHRWVTAKDSVRRHRGPRCAARAAQDVTHD